MVQAWKPYNRRVLNIGGTRNRELGIDGIHRNSFEETGKYKLLEACEEQRDDHALPVIRICKFPQKSFQQTCATERSQISERRQLNSSSRNNQ